MSTAVKPVLLAKVVVPARSGRIDLKGFFPRIPEKQIIPDNELIEFVGKNKNYLSEKPFNCTIESSPTGGVFSSLLNLTEKTKLNIDQMSAILVYLGTDGWPFLEIASPENETNVLIGYVLFHNKYRALIVEHEFNENHSTGVFQEEINLHVRELNHREDDPTLILKIA